MVAALFVSVLVASPDADVERGLLFASDGRTGAQPTKTPLGIAASGGGYRAMFNSMGLARALSIAGGWPLVTHLAASSGGSWFSTLLQYSGGFWADITNPTRPVEDIVNEIAARIEDGAQTLLREEKLVTFSEIDYVPSNEGRKRSQYNTLKATCAAQTVGASLMVKAYCAGYGKSCSEAVAAYPFADYEAFVAGAVLASVSPPATGDIMQPAALKDLTYIVGMNMLLDAYLSMDEVACLKPQTTDDISLGWLERNGASSIEWPVAFVRARGAASGWRFGDAIDGWHTAGISPAETCAEADLAKAEPLALPTPSTSLLASWSGAIAGFAVSPTQLSSWLDDTVGTGSSFKPCFPGNSSSRGIGAESMAPMVRGTDDKPAWRGNDGGSTDKSGVSHLIGRMQDDCLDPLSKLDCSDGLNIAVWDFDPYDMPEGNLRYSFMEPGTPFGSPYELEPKPPGTLRSIWWMYNRTEMQPSSTIFAGAYPSDGWNSDWLTIDTSNAVEGANPSELPESYRPQVWKGELTTVDNKWFGVRGGMKVHAVFIRPQLKQPTSSGVPLFSSYAARFYAPTAAALARDALPIFREMLQGVQ